MPPRTTKRKTTTNLKTKTNQKCQKIKLYGSQKTKEKKKIFIQTSRRGREDAARGPRAGKGATGGQREVAAGIPGEVAAGGTRRITFACKQTRSKNRGESQTTQPSDPVPRNKASKPLNENL